MDVDPKDLARMKELFEMRLQLSDRADRITAGTLSDRVKRARLRQTRDEMAAVRDELDALLKKFKELAKNS